ncbi:hypothetical protein FG386_000940 [Cryptosporidium ryanae]|uniref:uncharacterized protein n=1 Tax=Cryptosporidium ryanae TaxID=515981 RepID=UPI00351A4811|nr:hypothetical protein FG386_000940 [Cryptosporidium ryanae]
MLRLLILFSFVLTFLDSSEVNKDGIRVGYKELLGNFESHISSSDSKSLKDEIVEDKICVRPSGGGHDLKFKISDVPLVHTGEINFICNCIEINNEGVKDISEEKVSGLNCTSENNLVDPSLDLVSYESSDLDEYSNDFDLIESFKSEIRNSKLALEILMPLDTRIEEFCRVSLLGFRNKLVAFPKLELEHYSLVKVGMSICVYFGKKSNYYFDHPSPVTEILEGNLFETDLGHDFSFAESEFSEKKLFKWKHSDGREKVLGIYRQDGKFYEEYSDDDDGGDDDDNNQYGKKNSEREVSVNFSPFLRLTYVFDKPYPRVFVRSNVPYTKAINGIDRSVRRNFYSVAGKWQIANTPGYTRVKSENSILTLLGSKYNSVQKEAYVIRKLKQIHNKWKNLTFNSREREFLGCSVGNIQNMLAYSGIEIVDSTYNSFRSFPSKMNFRSVIDFMLSKYPETYEHNFKNPCNYDGNIRDCLKLIREKIRLKSLNYIVGNLFVNIIYELWITWGSDIWYFISLFDVEKIFLNYGFSSNVDLNVYSDIDPINTVFTRLFNIEPLKSDDSQDIISVLMQNLRNNDIETSSIEKDLFQFGVFSVNPLLISSFWKNFSRTYCKVISDSAFITWVGNKFTLNTQQIDDNNDEDYDDDYSFEDYDVSAFEDESYNLKNSKSVSKYNQKNWSWLLEPLPNYFDTVNPKVEIEHGYKHEVTEFNLPEFYEYEELNQMYSNNNPGNEEQNSIKRKSFFRSNYFSNENRKKWVSFIVKNVPFRDSVKRHLEFKCGIGSWPYKGGNVSWMGHYMCEVISISPYSLNKFDFSTFEDFYKDDPTFVKTGGNYFKRLYRARMIGIEFETSYPHRCGIGYLGNESKKTQTQVNGSTLLKLSLGFCIKNGFTLQWLSDNSFNIYTGMFYKYSQTLETGLTYYERNGFELSGSVEQKVHSNYTCSGVFLVEKEAEDGGESALSSYEFNDQTVGCQISIEPIVVTHGIKTDELEFMRRKNIGLVYNYIFGCDGMESENNNDGKYFSGISNHCVNFYPLLEKVKLDDNKTVCKFELEEKWKVINSKFPDVCKIGARIGDCHKIIRKTFKCGKSEKENCELDNFIVNTFIKPKNTELIATHFNQISLLLMKGISNYSKNWNTASVGAIKGLLSKLLSKKDAEIIYNKGINSILKDRMSIFMSEYSNLSENEILKEVKEIFSHSGILLDVHTLPLFWKLVSFRIEDIPMFISKNYLFEDNEKKNKLLINRIFRSKSNDLFKDSKTEQGIFGKNDNLMKIYGFSSSIPQYCPVAIAFYWIDKYMWQMYRYPGSKLQEIMPIST